MTSSEQEKRYYVKSDFLNLKHYVCQIFLPSFKKDEEAAAILKYIVLAIFNTQQSKDDVKVTSLSIRSGLFVVKYSSYPNVILWKI